MTPTSDPLLAALLAAARPQALRSQRWRDRRARFVPNASLIDPRTLAVDVIGCESTAKPFVIQHHYAGSFVVSRLSCGLFRNGAGGRPELVGVATFSVPVNPASQKLYTGLDADVLDLGRLVLLDDVPGNAETFFVSRALKLLRREKGTRAVIAYSDPIPRRTADGCTVHVGHLGVAYQGLSATLRGRSRARSQLLLPDGRILSDRAITKLRNDSSGHRYASDLLAHAGAAPRHRDETADAWLARLETSGFLRRRRHSGNLVYAIALTRDARRAGARLPDLPYPGRGQDTDTVEALPLFAAR